MDDGGEGNDCSPTIVEECTWSGNVEEDDDDDERWRHNRCFLASSKGLRKITYRLLLFNVYLTSMNYDINLFFYVCHFA